MHGRNFDNFKNATLSFGYYGLYLNDRTDFFHPNQPIMTGQFQSKVDGRPGIRKM